MTDELPPLVRTIRSRLPHGLPSETAVAEGIAYAVEVLHMAELRARIAELEVERDTAGRPRADSSSGPSDGRPRTPLADKSAA